MLKNQAFRVYVRCLPVLLSLVALSTGCATAHISKITPVHASTLRVAVTINDHATQRMTLEQLDAFRVIVNDTLRAGGITVVPPGNKGESSVTGDITVYNRGNKLLRYLFMFGPGIGTLESSWCLKDKSGNILGTCAINGSIRWGTGGGDFEEVIEKAGSQLVQFLKGSPK